MATHYFTADQQLGQKSIIELCDRPFGSLEEMHAAIVERWNDTVRDDSITWIVGDYTHESYWREGLTLLSQLRGRKRLVTGNHDKCWPGRSAGPSYQRHYFEAGFEWVGEYAHLTLPEVPGAPARRVAISHFPYDGDHPGRPERFSQLRLKDDGTNLIHGHLHNEYTVRRSTATGTVTVNVGVDTWDFRPVSGTEIAALIRDVESGTVQEH